MALYRRTPFLSSRSVPGWRQSSESLGVGEGRLFVFIFAKPKETGDQAVARDVAEHGAIAPALVIVMHEWADHAE